MLLDHSSRVWDTFLISRENSEGNFFTCSYPQFSLDSPQGYAANKENGDCRKNQNTERALK
jgi:hypothetical protein